MSIRNCGISTGFSRYAYGPSSAAGRSGSIAHCPVRMITGVSGQSLRKTSQTSSPFKRGIVKSVVKSDGWRARVFLQGHLAIGGGLDRVPPNSNLFNDGRSSSVIKHVRTHASGASRVIAEAAPRVPSCCGSSGEAWGRSRPSPMVSRAITPLSMVVARRGHPCLGPGRVSVRGSGKWRRRHTAKRRAAPIPWCTSACGVCIADARCRRRPRQHRSETW